jgi:UDP-N-acetylmuramoyl-L-alanyl-D-glutamate--2,6-diaminopimelate ligase
MGTQISGITADSRAVQPGFLFAALPGAKVDGRRFIAEAVARGAAAVLAPADTIWPAGVPPLPLLLDPSPRERLAKIAAELAGPMARPVRWIFCGRFSARWDIKLPRSARLA